MMVALALANLAEVTWFAGDGARAAALFRESLAEHQRLGYRQGVVVVPGGAGLGRTRCRQAGGRRPPAGRGGRPPAGHRLRA